MINLTSLLAYPSADSQSLDCLIYSKDSMSYILKG